MERLRVQSWDSQKTSSSPSLVGVKHQIKYSSLLFRSLLQSYLALIEFTLVAQRRYTSVRR